MAPPLSEKQERQLKNLYYKEGITFGRDKLFFLSKELELGISRRQIADWLAKQEIHQLYAPKRRSKVIQPTILKRAYAQIGIDLIDMQNEGGKNTYILTAIDLFSKYAWGQALKDKEAKTVAKGMEKIINQMDEKPSVLRSDKGSEFISKEFENLLKKKNIKQVLSLPGKPQSNGEVERFNGILKKMLRKYMMINNTREWEKVLQKTIDNYNMVPSRITKKPPREIIGEDEEVEGRIRKSVLSTRDRTEKNFEKGERVRIKLEKKNQEGTNWSKEIYVVSDVKKPRGGIKAPYYYVKEEDTGEKIGKRYYNNDLLKVGDLENKMEREEKFNISKLVKAETRKGIPGFIVQWKGYSSKDNTFEPLQNLLEDVPKLVKAYFNKHGDPFMK